MSRDVEFADVERCVRRFGARATLITVNDAVRPHAVTVLVHVDGDRLAIEVGARSRHNLVTRPALSLVWEPPAGGDYQLILDGAAEHVGDEGDGGLADVTVAVERGILHRLVTAPDAGPACVALEAV